MSLRGGSNPLGPWEVSAELHGFDAQRAGSPSNLQRCGGTGYSDWLRVDDGVSAMTREYPTTAVRDAFLSWWAATRGPRFAYVCLQAAHVPLHVPPASILPPGTPVPVTEREKYEAMLMSADWVIGEMLSLVDRAAPGWSCSATTARRRKPRARARTRAA